MTSSPFGEPYEHPLSEEEQKALVQRLSRNAGLALDHWTIDHRDELLGQVTAADRTALTVQAVIGYLVGCNLIRETEDPPVWLLLDIPAHLAPDVEAAKAAYRRIVEAIRS